MPPEILNGSVYTSKCDIWSLGIVLYRLLFGVYPFVPPKGTGIVGFTKLLTIIHHSYPKDSNISQYAKELIDGML